MKRASENTPTHPHALYPHCLDCDFFLESLALLDGLAWGASGSSVGSGSPAGGSVGAPLHWQQAA